MPTVTERTLVLIKPDAVRRGLVGEVLSRFERKGLAIVALDQRTSIANQYKADLFLSVHMNAAIVKGAHGAETYFLSLEASDELAKKAAEPKFT